MTEPMFNLRRERISVSAWTQLATIAELHTVSQGADLLGAPIMIA